MSTYADIPSRLAGESYGSQRILANRDAEIADFVSQVHGPVEFADVQQAVSAAARWILLAFTRRAASYAVCIQGA